MADVAAFYDDRITRVLSEDRPVFPVRTKFAELAELRSCRYLDVDQVLSRLGEVIGLVEARLGAVEGEAWDRCGVGTDGDLRRLAGLTRRLAHERRNHLLDLRRVLAR